MTPKVAKVLRISNPAVLGPRAGQSIDEMNSNVTPDLDQWLAIKTWEIYDHDP
jgi:hypothetical protein